MPRPCIFFRQNGALKKIFIDQIKFLEANDNYVKFYFHGGHFTVRTTLKEAVRKLPAKDFLMVHRSFAVSVDYIDEIAKGVISVFDFDKGIPVSKQHYPQIIKKLIILDAAAGEKIRPKKRIL